MITRYKLVHICWNWRLGSGTELESSCNPRLVWLGKSQKMWLTRGGSQYDPGRQTYYRCEITLFFYLISFLKYFYSILSFSPSHTCEAMCCHLRHVHLRRDITYSWMSVPVPQPLARLCMCMQYWSAHLHSVPHSTLCPSSAAAADLCTMGMPAAECLVQQNTKPVRICYRSICPLCEGERENGNKS